jgi:hypothetical protein
MANSDIRQAIRSSGIRFWEVAEKYGCADTTFSRKLRHELPDKEKAKIQSIVTELKEAAQSCAGGLAIT